MMAPEGAEINIAYFYNFDRFRWYEKWICCSNFWKEYVFKPIAIMFNEWA